jgi:hypothetical protein
MAKRRKPIRNPDHGKGLIKRLANQLSISEAALGEPQQQYTIMDFEVSWEYMPDPAVVEMTEADQERMEEIYPFLATEPKSVIQDLRDLAALYPKVPCLKNWLINCLRFGTTAERQEAMERGQELFRQMPNYFFSRTTLAELWLDENNVEKANELLFGKGCELRELYPDRKVFHISEIRHWCYLCARIKIFIGQPQIAQNYRDMLENLEPGTETICHLDSLLSSKDTKLLRIFTELKGLLPGDMAGE